MFDWEKVFSNTSANEKGSIIQQYFLNFILLETIVCNNRTPPWFNERENNSMKQHRQNVTVLIGNTY